jgi:hypothetical protein
VKARHLSEVNRLPGWMEGLCVFPLAGPRTLQIRFFLKENRGPEPFRSALPMILLVRNPRSVVAPSAALTVATTDGRHVGSAQLA